MTKEQICEKIISLCSLFTLSGFEYRSEERIRELYGNAFDEIRCDAVGSYLLIKYSKKENAPKIFIDAHIDEVGFLVSGIEEGGFLHLANAGGIDRAVLEGADISVYAKDGACRGVIIAAPPHLKESSDEKLPELDDLLLDMGRGYTREELEARFPIGTPCGFSPAYRLLGESRVSGKGFDDKACAAIAIEAVKELAPEELAGDVYISLSAREETARLGGACANCIHVMPDYAMVIDVNLGDAPDISKRETVRLGGGASISFSAATDRELTRMTAELCKREGIPFTPCACPSSTGTNATSLNLVKTGIPVVDIGLPLRNMHTQNEVIDLGDALSLLELVKAFAKDEGIRERFFEGGEGI